MGLFDQILGQVLGTSDAQSGSHASSLVQGVLDFIHRQGGVDGLAKQFGEQGLGQVVSSWIGTGQNRAISADQIVSALGSDTVSQLAQRAGISGSQGASALAALLPTLIDKLTPNGEVPQQGQLAELGESLLQGLATETPTRTV